MTRPGSLHIAQDRRGYVVLYRQAETNHCPGCGGTQWHIGRFMAECARCDTALPLVEPIAPDLPTSNEQKKD